MSYDEKTSIFSGNTRTTSDVFSKLEQDVAQAIKEYNSEVIFLPTEYEKLAQKYMSKLSELSFRPEQFISELLPYLPVATPGVLAACDEILSCRSCHKSIACISNNSQASYMLRNALQRPAKFYPDKAIETGFCERKWDEASLRCYMTSSKSHIHRGSIPDETTRALNFVNMPKFPERYNSNIFMLYIDVDPSLIEVMMDGIHKHPNTCVFFKPRTSKLKTDLLEKLEQFSMIVEPIQSDSGYSLDIIKHFVG